ncbi:MAG TPA: hypothetical protein PKD72_13885 [Gemmatales bacterium]|nr:hypothetical protein [Gemmatales bacterium]
MQGARWGWIAFIAAIGVLFAASSHDQDQNHKVTSLLRQELKKLSSERDASEGTLTAAWDLLQQGFSDREQLDELLQQQTLQLRSLRAERDKLQKELSLLQLDRTQLQQTVASLQLERSQTKRSVEQLRQGLHQLLNQADNVAQVLSTPAPGFAKISFETEILEIVPTLPCQVQGNAVSDGDAEDTSRRK